MKLTLADLPKTRATPFRLVPDAAARDGIARALGIIGLRKLSFAGEIRPAGTANWELSAELGATVVQACVATLDPVTTRIDETVVRRYLAEMPDPDPGTETEMPEDETADPLPETLDLAQVMEEALALALPPYPRAVAAGSADVAVTEPGKAPISDEGARPFAALKALRDNIEGGDD